MEHQFDVNSFDLANILLLANFRTSRKYEVPKSGKKKAYNALDHDEEIARPDVEEIVLDNQLVVVQDHQKLAQIRTSITILDRRLSRRGFAVPKSSELTIAAGETETFEVKDLVLEPQGKDGIKVSNKAKTKLPKQALLELSKVDEELFGVLVAEFDFFKTMRIFEKSPLLTLGDPKLVVQLYCESDQTQNWTLSFELSYSIKVQECCLYNHPLKSSLLITNLLEATSEWNPTDYELPYTDDEIAKNGYGSLNIRSFYHLISDVDNVLTGLDRWDTKLMINDLEVDLFDFQRKSINWLLSKEGVKYNTEKHNVELIPFFNDKKTEMLAGDLEDDRIAELLDLLSFGWKRVALGTHPSNEFLWYNKYTANICSSKFAKFYLSQVQTRPGAQGLLAEEMGLGKTVEIVSLILLNRRPVADIGNTIFDQTAQREVHKAKTTLVICPDSILVQWYEEISNMAPSLKVTIYKGLYHYNRTYDINSPRYRSASQIAEFLATHDVVILSYQTVAREIHHALYNPSSRPKRQRTSVSREKFHSTILESEGEDSDDLKASSSTDLEKEARNNHSSPLVLLQFWRIILDEVQMVSSKVSNALKISKIIPRYHSWGVSGTPIRRDLNDLHSFLLFSHFYPFNDGLSSPKQNKLVWETLINDELYVPYHFIRLFKRIAIRHTKKMVANDISLPPQKRILFKSLFTPVEKNLYDHKYQEFLEAARLDENGNFEPGAWRHPYDIFILMRDWLIKLRQACNYSRLSSSSTSTIDFRNAKMKTVEAVLEMLIEDNKAKSLQNERKIIMLQTERGQHYELMKKPETSLQIWEDALVPTLKKVELLKKELAEIETKWDQRTKGDDEEESNLGEKLTQLKLRLRSWLEILHRLYFFIASAHYQIYTPQKEEPAEDGELVDTKEIPDEELTPEALRHRKLENEYYDKAELLRRELLAESISKVNKTVKQLNTQRDDGTVVRLPEIEIGTQYHLFGMEAKMLYEKFHTLCEELNEQLVLINQWLEELAMLLSHYLKDETSNNNVDTKVDEHEYEDSLVTQDQAYAYLEVIQKCLQDRNSAILNTPETNIEFINKTNRLEEGDDEDLNISISRTDMFAKSDFHKDLERKRRKVIPQLCNKPYLSLKSLASKAKEMGDSMLPLNPDIPVSVEAQVFSDLVKGLKELFATHKKALFKIRKEHFAVLNELYNARIEYYKNLQSLSDTVTSLSLDPLGTPNLEISIPRLEQQIRVLEKATKNVLVRSKYLESLQKTMRAPDEDEVVDESERTCIICRCAIEAGVLTACGHQFCKDCLKEWLEAQRLRPSCPLCKEFLDKDSLYFFTYTRSNLQVDFEENKKPEDSESDSNSILNSLYQPLSEQMVPKIQEQTLLRSYGSKIDLIVKLTKYLISTEGKVQILIFSQWSNLLQLVGILLKANGIPYLHSDPSLDLNRVIEHKVRKSGNVHLFKKNPNITCFLMNAKVQAAGLTLVNASHVFLCEPLVNTSLELQAISRIHRIGQKKPTTIWMFVISDTVEEYIVKLSTKKRLEYFAETHKEEVSGELAIEEVTTEELTKITENLVDKKAYGGEVVGKDDLWYCLFKGQKPAWENFRSPSLDT